MSDLLDAVRDRLTGRTLLGVVAVVALWTVVFDAPPAQTAATVAGTAILGAGEVLAEATDRPPVRGVTVGAATLLGSGAMAALGADLTVPAVLGVLGAWVLADGVQSLRHGAPGAEPDEPAEPADGTAVYHQYVARRIQAVLEAGPRTRRELDEALDADGEAVDAALALLDDRDAIEREAGVYRRIETGPDSVTAAVRDRVGRLAKRIARPVTVEFGRGEREADTLARPEADSEPFRRGDAGTDERARERDHDRTGR